MTIYEYGCDECGDFLVDYPMGEAPIVEQCEGCGVAARRVYSVAMAEVMQEHWNVSAQAPISDPKQHDEIMKRKSEEVTKRTGIPHNFESKPIGDIENHD